ncbi:MAG: cobalamin biosynthesis protein [Archaeoglobaceae archaeon]
MRVDLTSIAVLCFEKDKEKLSEVVAHLSKRWNTKLVFYDRKIWETLMRFDCIVAYLASGIVIRGISEFLRSKWIDPAVIVIDKPMKHAVVLLGGHHGGNEVAQHLSQIGIEAVITTAMEFGEGVAVGIGFRKNTTAKEILEAISKALNECGLSFEDVRVIATVEGKENSEIVKVADAIKRPLFFVKKEDLNQMDLEETKAKLIGVKNVAEGCALKFSRLGELLLKKRVYGGVTVAIAR